MVHFKLGSEIFLNNRLYDLNNRFSTTDCQPTAEPHRVQRPRIRGDGCRPSRKTLNASCCQAGGHSVGPVGPCWGPSRAQATTGPPAVAGLVGCCAVNHCLSLGQSCHSSESAADGWRHLSLARTATALPVSGGLLGLNVACSSHLSQYVI